MSLDYMINEIKKREKIKEDLFNQLLEDCKDILQRVSHFSQSPEVFHPSLPKNVVGRRLPDKIANLERVLASSEKIEKSTPEDIERIQKALQLVIQHLKIHEDMYPLETKITIPETLQELLNEFAVLASIEANLKSSYIEYCSTELKLRATKTNDKMEKATLKNTFLFYTKMGSLMPYQSICRLKELNDEYSDILSPSFIASEYKQLEEKLWETRENYDNLLKKRENFKESAKHLTHLEKCEKKAQNYLDEIEKHNRKLDVATDDSVHELEELISSYQEAHKIMEEEIERITIFIKTEYKIVDVDDYNQKSKKLQIQIANTEITLRNLETKTTLLEQILDDIHKLRKKEPSKQDNLDDF